MTPLSVAQVSKESFSLVPTVEGNTLHVLFTGNGDMDATPALTLYLKQVHAEVIRLSLREVVFDLRDLYFMNSSCFKCFVVWVGSIRTLAEETRYSVRFLSNPRLHWQRRSLEALRHFAPQSVAVQVCA